MKGYQNISFSCRRGAVYLKGGKSLPIDIVHSSSKDRFASGTTYLAPCLVFESTPHHGNLLLASLGGCADDVCKYYVPVKG